MGKCEDAIVEKEKDVAYLKYNLNELNKCFNEKEEEVDLLKNNNSKIEEELKMLKEKNQDLKQYEIKMENLILKNQLLENKVNSIENQMLVSKKQLEDQQVEITLVKQEVEDVKSNLSEDIKFHLSKPLNDFQSSTNNDVKKIKDEVNKVSNEMRASRSYLDKSLNNTNNEINKLSVQITTVDKKLKDNFCTLNEKISKGAKGVYMENDPQNEIANLKHHVNNIENILFCNSSDGCKDILLQWTLQNYQYHFDIGEPVHSPTFLTQIKGYCFKLFVEWIGKEKENIGLFFKLCCGSNYDKPLEPFRMPYSLEMVDNKGNILSKEVSLSQIEADREDCFTLHPGENECESGCGYAFLSMPELNNYIFNDMLSIQCRFTPL